MAVVSVRAAHAPARDALSDSEDALIAWSDQLIDLVGAEGYEALLRRAHQLAARHSLVTRPEPSNSLRVIGHSTRPRQCAQLRRHSPDAFGTVLAALFTLIDEFLGPEITDSLLEPSAAPPYRA